MKIQNKTTRFLRNSLIITLVLCIFVFSFLAIYMTRSSTRAIGEVGNLYMTGMSERITMHFETTIDYRLSHVESILKTYPPDSADESTLRRALADSAVARGMSCLALLSSAGNFEMLYGDPVRVTDPPPFLSSLQNGEKKVAVGTDSAGENIVLMGIPADYTMENGEQCIALVAGISVDYFTKILALDEDNSLVYSHVIRRDGTFVIRSGDAFRDNYFDRIYSLFDDLHADGAEEVVASMTAAMNARESYSAVLELTERRHLYCVALPSSEWYLVTVMPYGALDQVVNDLSSRWMFMTYAGCAVILLALLTIFSKYFQMTRQQIQRIDEARQVAEKAQKDAEHANHAKSEFLSNMSHDIRTPMNAIVGMTAIATANIQNTQQVQNCLRKITLSSKHLLGLINDVLDMSKIESGKLTLNIDQVSLREVMDSIVNIVQPQVRAKNQHFDVFLHDVTVETVCCDSVRLNQILLNFLSNAIKFTPDGGTIQVTLYEEPSPRGDDYIRIHLRVKDNGIGMSPEFKDKIFESFSREDSARVHKTEGTGLGMAITKYIVDAMGGTIEVDSQLGVGSEFHVTLDLEQASVEETEMILPDWHMLVVDDDQQLCESTVEALKSIGISSEWTLDGESAVELVCKRHQQHQDFQIILLDWKLPGIDGIETARRIRQRMDDDIPILLISAYDWGEIEDDAKQAGITGFISKPLFKSTLFYGLQPFVSPADTALTPPSERHIDFTGKHILLAEDNDLNWEIAEELLSELGMHLDRAENGQICADLFARSTPGFYDAILMDLRMPVMNGYEATQAIRAMERADARSIPIIAMTADAFSEDIKKCLDCGMNAHVSKPIDVREVSRLLEKFILQVRSPT